MPKTQIHAIRHPRYREDIRSWELYRSAFDAGQQFIDKYLQRYSRLEDHIDFKNRKNITYVPAMAKAAVRKVINGVVERLSEVTRKGGDRTYQQAMSTNVDRMGSSMNKFIQKEILPELCPVGQVGVYVDKVPMVEGATMADVQDAWPYIYTYKREDFLSWAEDGSSAPGQFSSVLLREHRMEPDPTYGLVTGMKRQYRLLNLMPVNDLDANGETIGTKNMVQVRLFDHKGTEFAEEMLDIPMIPFVSFELSEPLMEDISGIQVALMNLESSDLSYVLRMNYPFYVEQYDQISEQAGLLDNTSPDQGISEIPGVTEVTSAGNNETRNAASKEVRVGSAGGRRYPKGMDKPSFIHPSAEPLEVSMKKQAQLEQSIQEILGVTLSRLKSTNSEETTEESGLAAIGMELMSGEQLIAEIWDAYQQTGSIATVAYPKSYEIKSEEDRRKEAKELDDLRSAIPSRMYQKQMSKEIADAMFKGKVDQVLIDNIHTEIDNAETMTSNVEEISTDLENGLVSNKTASKARGYLDGEVEQAEVDHAKRIERIMAAQTKVGDMQTPASRGVTDLDPEPINGPKGEKTVSAEPALNKNSRGRRQRGRGVNS